MAIGQSTRLKVRLLMSPSTRGPQRCCIRPSTRRSQTWSPIVISSSKRKMKSSAASSISALDQKGVKRKPGKGSSLSQTRSVSQMVMVRS